MKWMQRVDDADVVLLEVVAYDKRGEPVHFQTIAIPPNPRKLLISS
ncbi:hypothetical protein RA280_10155 [Cupriavidus sp. CV2]|nr:hypothetical protein [Cupriavidus sp. CV2]MDW3682109.1 hypothetical protein [Cupriavidus sp. CV2]